MIYINSIIVSIIITFPIFYFVSYFGIDGKEGVFYLEISLFLSLFLLIQSVLSSEESIFVINFCCYMIFLYIIPGMVFSSQNIFPFFLASYAADDIAGACLIVLVFLLFFLVSYLFYKSESINRNVALPRSTRKFSRKQLINIKIIVSIFIAVSIVGIVAHGKDVFFVTRGELQDTLADQSGDSFLTLSITTTQFCSFYAILLMIIVNRGRIFRELDHSLLFLSFCVFILANNPLSTPRNLIFSYLICGIVIFFRTGKKIFKIIYLFSYIVCLFTVFPMLSQLARGAPGAAIMPDPLTYISEQGMDFDGLQSTINIKDWADHDGLQYGHQLISALLFFVPRSIWGGKAEATGGRAADYMGFSFHNLSAPLPAEFYSDFGWLGVAVGGLFCGWLIQRLDQLLQRARDNAELLTLMLYGIMAGFTTILLRGSLLGCIGYSSLAILIAFFLARLAEEEDPNDATLFDPDAISPSYS